MNEVDMKVEKRGGFQEPLNIDKIHGHVSWAAEGLEGVSINEIETGAHIMFYDGIKTSDIHKALIQATIELIDEDSPNYTYAAARLLLLSLYKEVTGGELHYPHIRDYLAEGIAEKRLDKNLLEFDLERINEAVSPERDYEFTYLGLRTVADRYLIRRALKDGEEQGDIIEMPQHFWMRVAMGLALRDLYSDDLDPTARAIEYYDVMSRLEFLSSTPTLFNAGTKHSQMSSCYLNNVDDSIWDEAGEGQIGTGIFGTITECAMLSKFAGGIGTDWSFVRPMGSPIVSTNGISSGVVPYLKIFNDTAIAVNQGGKRNGAFAAYLEPTHGDFMEFCDLKRQSGDDRRRTHDIFPAAWIPDLFMERVRDGDMWSLFGHPYHAELHKLYGDEFKARYLELEKLGLYKKQVPAMEIWKKMLTRLTETGAPWVTFKDESNRRNPQSHVGVIGNSNLCTEITLNTSSEETAVCNLGSVNLARVNTEEDLRRVISTAMRMLDNVIDLNFYPSMKAETSNLRHRPVGLGVMGLSELLVENGIDWESEENLQFQDELFEMISHEAIRASALLAKERGAYESYEGSKWSVGMLPIDTARDQSSVLDWTETRRLIKKYGMRNSNTMAIAPTATIANIAGTLPGIEPRYERVHKKENMSGFFKVVDPSLRFGKPELCKESFEIDQKWLIRAAAVRQKWIDQSQSLNLFRRQGIKGVELSEWYFLAWELGLKTTYYLKNQMKKSTGGTVMSDEPKQEEVVMCSIDNPDCESCQ